MFNIECAVIHFLKNKYKLFVNIYKYYNIYNNNTNIIEFVFFFF